MGKRLTADQFRFVAEQRGFVWIDDCDPPPQALEKTTWMCKRCGRTLEAEYHYVRRKQASCPECSKTKRLTATDFHIAAFRLGIRWIPPEDGSIPRSSDKSLWECPYGHRWQATYVNVRHAGSSCPICYSASRSDFKRHPPSAYKALARRRKIEWLGPLPKNSSTKTTWRCANGHSWDACYSNIRQGTGCPHCYNLVNGQHVSRNQIKIANWFNGELNYPVVRYRIDVALIDDGFKVAIEYDCQHWHQGNEEHERKRDAYLLEQGWRILHIRTRSILPGKRRIQSAINRLHKGETIVEIVTSDWIPN